MCYLIAIALATPAAEARKIIEAAGFSARDSVNPHVRNIFPRRSATRIEVTNGMCSCDLINHPRPALDDTKERLRYKDKGWSDAKIDRALAAKRNARHRPAVRKQSLEFARVVQELVAVTGSVSILTHFYNGAFDDETIEKKPEVTHSAAQFLANSGALSADVVVHVTR